MPSDQSFQRVIAFERINNFRDFGNLRTPGGTIAAGRLYRAAHQHHASEADVARIRAMGVLNVVDLRRAGERALQPAAWFDQGALAPRHLHGGDDADDPADGPPHLDVFMHSPDLSVAAMNRHTEGLYRRIPFSAAHVRVFTACFRALAGGSGASLIHCSAGKDRTGVLVALVLHLLGAHPDDIMEDYLLTNQYSAIPQRAPRWRDNLARQSGRDVPLEAVEVIMGVAPSYLAQAFAAIEAQYGSTERYLAEILGVGAELREKIRESLLA